MVDLPLLARLPRGRDGRPLRASHRLAVAGLLLAAFGAGVGPAMSSLQSSTPVAPAQTRIGTSHDRSNDAARARIETTHNRSYDAAALRRTTTAPPPYVVPAAYQRDVPASSQFALPAASQLALPAASQLALPAASQLALPAASQLALPAHSQFAAPAVLPAPNPTPAPKPAPDKPGEVKVTVDGGAAGRNQAVQIMLLMTVLSVAPSLLLLCTSFTKIAVVLSLTRNALGTPTIPPNQVLAGLALFLSLFVMSPILSQMNDRGVQPYLNNKIELDVAVDRGGEPLRLFMAEHTGDMELQTMIKMSKSEQPKNKADTEFATLIPAFVLSELKSAFIIGFVVFIPFLIIDLVVSSVLMSMGMMMLPPVMISLPFKLLLFVMVDGWSLIATALVTSYR